MGAQEWPRAPRWFEAKVPKSCIPCSLICVIILLGLGATATALLMLPQGAMASSSGSQMTSNNRITSLFVMFFLLRLIGLFGYLSPDMSCSKGILAVCVNVPFCFPWPISMPELRPLFLSLGQCASWTEFVTKRLLSGP